MWKSSRLTEFLLRHGFTRCLHKSPTVSRQWVQIAPNKQFRAQTQRGAPPLSKQEFKKKLEDCLSELRETDLKMPGLSAQDLSTDKNVHNHPLVKAMNEKAAAPWPKTYLDSKSADILCNDDLKREFLRQYAMCHEWTHRFNVPACGFSSFSMSDVDKYLSNRQSMVFILRKSAMKSRTAIKKNIRRLEREENPSSEYVFRSDPIPVYNLKKKLHEMAEYRIERTRDDNYPLLIDMSFESFMHEKAKKSMHKQLDAIMKYNISNTIPFHITYCNMDENSHLYSSMMERKSFGFPNGLATVTSKSLVEIDGLGLEDMIYLSPDASVSMNEFDTTKSYIIGGLVDVGGYSSLKVTYNAARRLGIKKVKFPLTKYLLWGNKTGRDELTLDVAFQVLHTFRDTGCWLKAFVHVPKRFHRGLTEFGLSQIKGQEELLDWYNTAFDRRINAPPPAFMKDSSHVLGWS